MKKIHFLICLTLLLSAFSQLYSVELTEGFEGTTFPPLGWTVLNGGDGNTWERYTDEPAHTGSACAAIAFDYFTAHNDWLITPRLTPTLTNHVFSFWAKNLDMEFPEKFNVKLSTLTNQAGDFSVTLATEVTPGYYYTFYTYDLSSYTGQNIYVAIQAISTNMYYLFIDDVTLPSLVVYPEPTNFPTNFISTGYDPATISLSWTGSVGTQLPIKYLILAKKGSGSFATVTDGIPVPDDSNWSDNNAAVNVVHTVGTNTYTFTGLSAAATYDFVIYPYTNSSSDINYKTGGIAPTVSITTDAFYHVDSFPYLQDFEAAWQGSPAAPAQWTQIVVSGENPWERNGAGYNSSGSALAFSEWGDENLLITPALNLGTRDYWLKFWIRGGTDPGNVVEVQIGNNNNDPSSFGNGLADYWTGDEMPTEWTPITLDLSAFEGTKFIAFRLYGSGGGPIMIDDVLIEEIPPSPAVLVSPSDAANNIIRNISLHWAEGSGSPTGYMLNFGTDGNGVTPPSSIASNMDIGTSTSYTPSTQLAMNTTYYWQVVPYNSGGNASDCPIWSFTTLGPVSIPGNALNFDGSGDYVTGTGINTSLTAFTIEAWINHNSLNGTVQRYITLAPETAVLRYDGTIYGGYKALHFYIKRQNGSLFGFKADSVLVTGEWMHVAGTFDGNNLKLYLNGTLIKSAVVSSSLYPPSGNFSLSSYGETFDGKMDEMRIWNYARSQAQIRENMHLSLTGMEAGLVNYWQFNESSGTSVLDIINYCNGTMNNMTNDDWVGSTVPFGSGVSNTQTEAAGVVSFTNTDLSMSYTTHNSASVTVNKINASPNTIPTGMNEVFDNQYWVVHRYGTGSFNGNVTLTVSEDLTADDQAHPNQIRLYSRARNTDGNWNVIKTATSVNAALNQATFSGISECSQFLVCRNYPTISNSNGTALTFDGVNDYVNLGNSGSFNTGDYITIEAWIKPNSLAGRSGIFSTRLNNQAGSFQLEVGTGSGGTGRVAVSGVNRWFAQTGDNAISTGEWVHIAYTRDGMSPGSGGGIQHIYINGVSQAISDDNSYSFVSNTSDKVLGCGTSGGQLFNGAMDEVRIWNMARTPDQIRESMYLPLTGSETGLISYWQFNEMTGTRSYDYVSLNNGTLVNMGNEDWVSSTIPFSSGVTNSQNETTGTVTFTGTGLSSFFTTANGSRFTVTKLNGSPNEIPSGLTNVYDSQYWEMNRFGFGSFAANLTFTVSEDLTLSNQYKPSDIKLYRRGSSSDANWQLIASATSVNADLNTVTFNNIATTGQFLIGHIQSPAMNITPTSITQTLYVGDNANTTLSIENTGDQPLNYTISVNGSSRNNSNASTRGSGTPGSYSYSWVDSDQAGGPAFNWIDISSLGTEIITNEVIDYGDSDDGYKIMQLPFNFPYFNSSYNQVQISTNGLLTFNTGYEGSDIDSYPIPDANEPNNLIAAYWEDLSAETWDAHIYFYDDSSNNRVIIEYQNYSHYITSGYFETFEVILNSDGCITMQYLNASALNNLCAVGIENQDGTQGLQIVRNASYIHSNLAIKICPMVSVNSWSGTVNAYSTNQVIVKLNADALWAGDFTSNIIITSNEPDNPQHTIPVNVHVNPYQALNTPQNLAVETIGENIKLSWDAVTTATSYNVYACSNPYGTFIDVTSSGSFNSKNMGAGTKSRATWTSGTTGIDRMFYYVKAVR